MGSSLTFQFNAQNTNQMLLAQASNSMIDMPSLATSSSLHDDHPDSQEAQNKRLQEFIEMVDATQAYLARLQKEIDDLEAKFRERDGDAWREALALKVLDPDEIPQRREGETIEEYRERLEPLLIDKMLNADGSIKSEYQNHPEFADYAQWAQKKHHYNIAKGYASELENPNTPPERREEIHNDMKQNADIETLVYADRDSTPESDLQGQVKDIADGHRDRTGEAKQQIDDSFFQLKS